VIPTGILPDGYVNEHERDVERESGSLESTLDENVADRLARLDRIDDFSPVSGSHERACHASATPSALAHTAPAPAPPDDSSAAREPGHNFTAKD